MGKPAVPLRYKLISLCAAGLLACGLAPTVSLADDLQDDSVAASFVLADSKGSGEAATPNSALPSAADGPTLASTLAGTTTSIVSADVVLDAAEPVVGSFTVDGLTYAVGPDGLTLVAVDGATSDSAIAIPATVTYNGIAYDVIAIGPYAFYLSGATDVALPGSIVSVDDRAFCSSDVGAVSVDPANPNITSFDGALCSADYSRLLLIPEGRKGSVLLSCETEVVQASLFSHCSLVDSISVEEGGAAFSSWEGCLYSADGTTLLRVPAGATEITIRDGCTTTITAGALEGCAKLERINAPASVTSISPDLFESVPTVSLPIASVLQTDSQDESVAASLAGAESASADNLVTTSQADSVAGPFAGPGYEGDARSASADPSAEGEAATQPSSQDETTSGVASSLLDQANASTDFILQLTAMVALSSADDDLPEIDPSSIEVTLSGEGDADAWGRAGFSLLRQASLFRTDAIEASGSSAGLLQGRTASASLAISFFMDAWGRDFYVSKAGAQSAAEALSASAVLAKDDSIFLYCSGWLAMGFGNTIENVFGANGLYNQCSSGYGAIWTDEAKRPPRRVMAKVVDGCDMNTPGRRLTLAEALSGASLLEGTLAVPGNTTAYLVTDPYFLATFDPGVGASLAPNVDAWGVSETEDVWYDEVTVTLPDVTCRENLSFLGWTRNADRTPEAGGYMAPGTSLAMTDDTTFYAAVKPFTLGFEVDSEPGDAGYPGDAKPDEAISIDSGQVPIEDPKRPGYVFEGWVIPTEDGTEAVDQELVYQGDDGKWYVDASKLPDYAGDDGRVELTARWTSVISVDVPSSVTFYADLVTQGQESREGAASGGAADGAFGQSKVSNQSQVDLRVVGLESSAVKTEGSTLGADSVLKKADAATPSSSTQKLLSLYPSAKQWTAEDLQNPDAVGGDKAASAVDFDLDDVLLERSFAADDFTIAAGGTLNMGYRLNLAESGQQLDYDKLSTLSEGQSASIANVSYCFATNTHLPTATGSTSDDLYIEHGGRIYGLDDIKASANCIATLGEESPCYQLYSSFLSSGMDPNDPSDAHGYVRWGDGTTYSVRIIGISYDDRVDGVGKAPLTFEFVNLLNTPYQMRPDESNAGGWGASLLRDHMNPYGADELMSASGTGYNDIWNDVPMGLREVLVPVGKKYYRTCNDLSTLVRSDDYLFIRGLGETCVAFLSSGSWVSEQAFLRGERPDGCTAPYQYFALLGIDQTAPASINLVSCGYEKSPTVSVRHWQRSLYVDYSYTFCSFEKYNAGPISDTLSSDRFGVRPCFCL